MIHVIGKFEPIGSVCGCDCIEIDTTSQGNNRDLSPFCLGPVPTYEPGVMAMNVENLWQYSKVYQAHAYIPGTPSDVLNPMAYEPATSYYAWRDAGWARQRADRYPMGKGAKPLYSYWKGTRLNYIQARKAIYIPAYANAVVKTQSYATLYKAVMAGETVVLRDFDGHNHIKMGMTLKDVVNNPKRPMGHAFVLAMLLTGVINECLQ